MTVEPHPASTSTSAHSPVTGYEVGSRRPDVQEAAHRAALQVLRPELATVWLDATAGPQGWPPDVVRHLAVVGRRARVARTTVPLPGRPHRGPDAVALNPSADDEFAAACALAARSSAVEAMSRRGRLVLARLDVGAPLRLRLTPAQRDALLSAVPGLAGNLQAIPRTTDGVDAPAQGPVGRWLARWRSGRPAPDRAG